MSRTKHRVSQSGTSKLTSSTQTPGAQRSRPSRARSLQVTFRPIRASQACLSMTRSRSSRSPRRPSRVRHATTRQASGQPGSSASQVPTTRSSGRSQSVKAITRSTSRATKIRWTRLSTISRLSSCCPTVHCPPLNSI